MVLYYFDVFTTGVFYDCCFYCLFCSIHLCVFVFLAVVEFNCFVLHFIAVVAHLEVIDAFGCFCFIFWLICLFAFFQVNFFVCFFLM